MAQYQEYPKVKTTPNRKNRKSERAKVFLANKKMTKLARKAQREARNETAD